MSDLDELRNALAQLQKELSDLKGKSTGKKPEQSESVRQVIDAQQRKLDELTSMLKILMSVKPLSETTDPKSCKQSKCFFCKKPGHVIRECRARKRKEQKTQAADSTKEAVANDSEN